MKSPSIEERVEGWRAFFARRNPRKLLGFFYGSEYPAHRYHAAASLPEGRDLRPEDFEVETYLKDYEDLYRQMERFPGDFIFSGSAFWGIPWLEATLGCPIRVSRQSGSLYARPPQDFRSGRHVLDFDADSPWVRKLAEFLDKLAPLAAGRFPLATSRMRGIADLLCALYGEQDFVYAMIDHPEEVERDSTQLTQFYIEFARFQLRRIPLFYGGVGSFYYHLWAPSGTVWHQEDSVMLLSPELYQRFIMPCDRKIFEALPGNIVHFHSTGGYLPVDEVLSLAPNAVEMHIDAGGPSAESLHGMYQKILEKAPLVVWGKLSARDFEWIFRKLPNAGVAVNAVVSDVEEAHDLWNHYILSD